MRHNDDVHNFQAINGIFFFLTLIKNKFRSIEILECHVSNFSIFELLGLFLIFFENCEIAIIIFSACFLQVYFRVLKK